MHGGSGDVEDCIYVRAPAAGLSTFNDAAELSALMRTGNSLTLPGERCALGAQDPVLESLYADVMIFMGSVDAY